ncbi:hypothetical protein FKW77_010391 [Venturia effusa]|uniref:SET domain-containing protein n=1 Tax=Venturia effusa TaxID=50376 RepID=A0A517L6H9_9PEZI|nr:hypothetical protein FKW77_010391 [Venturia effusa]
MSEQVHTTFRRWAEGRGVRIDGLRVSKLPGKGIGVVASRYLKKEETLISVPASSLITLDSRLVQVHERKIKDCSVHGSVAAALTLNHGKPERVYKAWESVWPTMEDLQPMPFTWSPNQQDHLPPAVQALLKHQRSKFDRDWAALDGEISENLKDLYEYYWLIVNTRCFYWTYFKKAKDAAKKGKSLSRDDCMALCPFADYLNHADEGCTFHYDTKGITVVCNRDYAAGEEVVVSYGAHSNDYLLVEYGFILQENKDDSTKVDHIILPMLTKAQATFLEQHDYLGDYTLDSAGVCYRTQVALRSTFTSAKRMEQFLAGGWDGEKDDAKVATIRNNILQEFQDEIEAKLAELVEMEDSAVVSTLVMRWEQILAMTEAVLEKGEVS